MLKLTELLAFQEFTTIKCIKCSKDNLIKTDNIDYSYCSCGYWLAMTNELVTNLERRKTMPMELGKLKATNEEDIKKSMRASSGSINDLAAKVLGVLQRGKGKTAFTLKDIANELKLVKEVTVTSKVKDSKGNVKVGTNGQPLTRQSKIKNYPSKRLARCIEKLKTENAVKEKAFHYYLE